ncbi:hypothetical protein KsCSTR_42280 [Candidatus Kuenenia stuttgartiensis]|uniref:Uncharacterized protein n=1 Tax=Kuenenia stuttgartiensis TaxID=174633 RepID=A0A6G7GWM2_KUEST|nr:hypothetical protein KsCSTR_42280 [Candidatus Kuenenia stuttgartiensis]
MLRPYIAIIGIFQKTKVLPLSLFSSAPARTLKHSYSQYTKGYFFVDTNSTAFAIHTRIESGLAKELSNIWLSYRLHLKIQTLGLVILNGRKKIHDMVSTRRRIH